MRLPVPPLRHSLAWFTVASRYDMSSNETLQAPV